MENKVIVNNNGISIKTEEQILKEELTKVEAEIESAKALLTAKEQLVDEIKTKLAAKQFNELECKEITDKVLKTIQDKMMWKSNIVLQKNCSPIQKHYLGDVKWVLYQYICDLNPNSPEPYAFRCGNYAYNKIATMECFKQSELTNYIPYKKGVLNLNGEEVIIMNIPEFNKKQLVISKNFKDEWDNSDHREEKQKIYPDDIVLYFA